MTMCIGLHFTVGMILGIFWVICLSFDSQEFAQNAIRVL